MGSVDEHVLGLECATKTSSMQAMQHLLHFHQIEMSNDSLRKHIVTNSIMIIIIIVVIAVINIVVIIIPILFHYQVTSITVIIMIFSLIQDVWFIYSPLSSQPALHVFPNQFASNVLLVIFVPMLRTGHLLGQDFVRLLWSGLEVISWPNSEGSLGWWWRQCAEECWTWQIFWLLQAEIHTFQVCSLRRGTWVPHFKRS